ncbi:hypothetical protein [Mycolicibacterium tusciae]|uniref:hypothetical protein n=1 Tax=Mycolicibacterium tusciae TaxID=75922 RepID=UPI001EF93DA7|nr:hypothetical protein [Mycolicibacterium tusciae]
MTEVEEAGSILALLRVHAAEAGRRVRVSDLWIAAIAAAKHLPVVTQDGHFDVLEGVAGLAIIHV